jgi:hypothetical protein
MKGNTINNGQNNSSKSPYERAQILKNQLSQCHYSHMYK